MKILLDGIEFQGILAEDDLVLNISKGVTKSAEVNSADAITFTGESFEYLKDKFFVSNDGRNETAEVTISDVCCTDEPFVFNVRADNSSICFQTCEIISEPVAVSPEQECYGVLNSTEFWNFNNFTSQNHPKIRYCDDRGFGQFLAVFFIDSLINILNFFGANIDESGILKCNKSHPAPLVKDVLQNIADMCGLELVAPIFTSAPYDQVSVLFAANSEGTQSPVNWIDDNATDLTAIDFLELIKIPFNSDYCIKDGQLIIDRVDRLRDDNVLIGDVVEMYSNGLTDNVPCYTYGANKNYSEGTFKFSEDSIDQQANPAARGVIDIEDFTLGSLLAFPYSGRVDFNNPFDPSKTGSLDIIIPFAPITVVGDRKNDFNLVENRRINAGFTGYLRLEKGRTVFPKLIIIDIVNPATNEGIVSGFLNTQFSEDRYENNIPLRINNLYDNFWSIEDPRINYNPYILEDFTWAFNCEEVNTILENGTNIKIQTELGFAYPERISIDFGAKTITASGNKIIQ